MKNLTIRWTFTLLIIVLMSSCSTTTYYIVRHAEKRDNSVDPPLNANGTARALILADTLENKNISSIFVSQRQRTQLTAAPTASFFHIVPTVISSDSTTALVRRLKAIRGKNILVVWHSENVHNIVNELVPAAFQVDPIGNTFDNLFIIRRKIVLWSNKTTLTRTKYGPPG